MGTVKKATKSKFVSEELNDIINESKFLQTSPKKKTQKRQRLENTEEEDFNKLIGQCQANLKKKKHCISVNECGDSRQKVLDVMNKQLTSRKLSSGRLLKNLSDVLVQSEADYTALKDNEQKLKHLTGALLKCIQQTANAHEQKLKSLNEIHATYKKESEDLDKVQEAETSNLGNELEEDIKRLQQKLMSEAKRSGWKTLHQTIFHAMQNDF